MSQFSLEILTPGKQVFNGDVQEVILPAYDGDRGILPGHEDFVGMLGTGALKLVKEGNDYWYMISSGVYEVRDGKVSILAELAEGSKELAPEKADSEIKTLQEKLIKLDQESPEGQKLKKQLERLQARVEVHKRTSLVN